MSTLEQLLKSIKQQNEVLRDPVGLGSMHQMLKSMNWIKDIQQPYRNMGWVTEIAESIARQTDHVKVAQAVIFPKVSDFINAHEVPQVDRSVFALGSSILELSKINAKASANLAGFASSQALVSSSLHDWARVIDSAKHLKTFNTFDFALSGLSKSFLKDISQNQTWDDLVIAEEANEAIARASGEVLTTKDVATVEDLEALKLSIFEKLNEVLTKTRTVRAKTFILELIAVIGFLLTLYGLHQQRSDLTNEEVLQKTKEDRRSQEFLKIRNKEITKKIKIKMKNKG